MARALVRRALLAPPVLRPTSGPLTGASSHCMCISSTAPRYSSLGPPTVFSVSFWKSLVPKPFRRGDKAKAKSKEWNPVTFYIVLFLLIGSMSINMIKLKKEEEQFSRQSSVRIDLLKDVIERIKKGEDVDVEKALGTGDPVKEQGWEELIREIERDDTSRTKQKQEKPRTEQPTKVNLMNDNSLAKPKSERPSFF